MREGLTEPTEEQGRARERGKGKKDRDWRKGNGVVEIEKGDYRGDEGKNMCLEREREEGRRGKCNKWRRSMRRAPEIHGHDSAGQEGMKKRRAEGRRRKEGKSR